MNCPNCQQVLHDDVYFCGSCGAPTNNDDAPTIRLSPVTQIDEPRETAPNGGRRDPLIGRVLDSKYELVERLGEGGMGTVYRARRLHIGDDVAVKLLRTDLVLKEEAIERFRREARSAAMISHPNVVSIHDFSDASGPSGMAYIVMELVKGTSLRTLLECEGRMRPERAVALMRDICAGVGVAHRQGLLHRDLKPDNVIITPANTEGELETAKVVDFGLAKLRDVSAGAILTQTGTVIGTLHYMSPEQCSGEEVDARADVYSLGAMLFEMLTGGPPFQAHNFTGLIAKHLHEPPPSFPVELNIPGALAAACTRALSKDRDLRQPDASSFNRDLQKAMAAPPAINQLSASSAQTLYASGQAENIPKQQQTTRWVKPALALCGVLLVALLLAGAGLALKYGVAHLAGRNANKSTRNRNQNNIQTGQALATPPTTESDNPATEATAIDLRDTWTGTYGPLSLPANLIIKNQRGDKIDGVLEQGDVRIAFTGTLNPTSRQLTMKQSAVLSGRPDSWSLGNDMGIVSSNGKKISGTGRDAVGSAFGISYEWSFSRP
jgi:serine/threonine protein kinase